MPNEGLSGLDALSEAEIQPVLELLQGGDATEIARRFGLDEARLCRLRDELLSRVSRQRSEAARQTGKQVGRNDPCPCGSGKKYKHCCMDADLEAQRQAAQDPDEPSEQRQQEQERLAQNIEKAFTLIRAEHPSEAIAAASKLIRRYPNEDRLHDIVATGNLYTGNFEAAIAICRQRLATAEEEKAYFVTHRRYHDADIDNPALSYYYPPLTWLQKYWVALKAAQYHSDLPVPPDPAISALVETLKSADDTRKFPQTQSRGLELRRDALQSTLEAMKAVGSPVVAYIRPLAVKYGWSGLLVPEILAAIPGDESILALLDISMFGFAYASGASLHYLEKRGPEVVPHIRRALMENHQFDPIKTGMVSVLGNLGGPDAYALLIDLLAHESPHLVNWAGDALGKFNNPEALPAMIAASERIGGQPMIDAAIEHLRDLE
jgi:hypothetical protein